MARSTQVEMNTAYAQAMNELEGNVQKLVAKIAEMKKKKTPHWGHVGDARYYSEVIERITNPEK